MTAFINKLKDKTGNQQLPVTHERAVRDDNGTTLESKMQNLEGAMDKAYVAGSGNGMGRITLPKNNGVLTSSMMQATNTIYVIQYDFTLGEDITVPANCVLEFDGGSINGNNNTYTITGNNTVIDYNSYDILKSVNVAGTFKNDSVVIDIFDDDDWAVKMAKSIYISSNIRMVATNRYTAKTKLLMNGYFTNANIDCARAFIDCQVADMIECQQGVHNVSLHDVYVENSNNTPGTFLYLNGQPSTGGVQIRKFNIDRIDIHYFDIGIRASCWRQSSLTNSSINAKIGLLYEYKSAEDHISNCLFNGSSATGSKAIYCYDESHDGAYPEGLQITNCDFAFFDIPVHLRDIYQCTISNCWIECTGEDKNCIYLERHNRIHTVSITNCNCKNGRFYSIISSDNSPESITLTGCTFMSSPHKVFNLESISEAIISNCVVTNTTEGANQAVFSTSYKTYNVNINNILVLGTYEYGLLTNYAAHYLAISNVDCPERVLQHYYADTSPEYVHHVSGLSDTPIVNETRRVDGVLKYWDGSAWQAM